MGLFRSKKKKEVVPLQEPVMAGGRKKRYRVRPWISRGIIVSFLCAAIFSSFYGVFQSNAEKYMSDTLESSSNIRWLYQSCYLLYRDLCNSQREEFTGYTDLYLETEDSWKWMQDEKKLENYIVFLEAAFDNTSLDEELSSAAIDVNQLKEAAIQEDWAQAEVTAGRLDETWLRDFLAAEDGGYNLSLAECIQLQKELQSVEDYFQGLEDSFRSLNSTYDYCIEDNVTGDFITNMSLEDRNRGADKRHFRLSFVFDSAGNVSVGNDVLGKDENQIRKYANEMIRENLLQSNVAGADSVFGRHGTVKMLRNCTVTYEISKQAWMDSSEGAYTEQLFMSSPYNTSYEYYVTVNVASVKNGMTQYAYLDAGIGGILYLAMLCVAALGMFLPLLRGTKPWKDDAVCRFSFELLFLIGCAINSIAGEYVMRMIAYVGSGRAGGAFSRHLNVSSDEGEMLAMYLNLLVLTVFFFSCWYMGICARAVLELGMKEYIKQRSLIYRFFPFMKSRFVRTYQSLSHQDLTKDAHLSIIKILVINGAILFFISCLWLGGLGITIVYSVILYFILRRYVSELQTRYRILLGSVDEIAQGRLNVTINEDLGVFEPFREQVFKIQDGLKKAVDVEVKSQRMKAELVTNMSHDLKTPLTAIITYANLLKEENLTEEQRREYLATLERKALRLKDLIDDLFEFSKANSENITLNIMDIDIMNLLKQVAFEMSDKIQAAELDVRMNLTDERVILPLDSQKTYRIYENLFGNIAKYALHGTRVYVNGFRIDDMVVITLKNISAQEITVDASELTERFVRGDASRNTEGSGLGLAIAKSFTELQGGQLSLEVDGDLFKVTTTWHIQTDVLDIE